MQFVATKTEESSPKCERCSISAPNEDLWSRITLLHHPFRTNRTPISKWTVLLSGKMLHKSASNNGIWPLNYYDAEVGGCLGLCVCIKPHWTIEFLQFQEGREIRIQEGKQEWGWHLSEEIAILRPTGGPSNSCLRFNQRKKPPQSRRVTIPGIRFLNVFTHLDTNDYNIKNTF